MPRNLTNAFQASPDQSSTVLGLAGAHPVRFKNVFILRFVRKVDVSTDDWKQGLTFLAKSIERPSVQPVTEEINQYNRKRVIHTGVKYGPINCSFYDTADGAALSMWAQYANYYFGDFGHAPADYTDDILNNAMSGGNSYGFGIVKNPMSSEPNGINSQFFFDRVEVYQLWGGEYVSYQLINPRITAFTPDDLDYEANAISMINMTLQYESIYYVNSSKSQKVSSSSFLTQIFGGDFSGHTPEPYGAIPKQNSFVSTGTTASSATNPSLSLSSITNPNAFNISTADVQKAAQSGLGVGSISKYGSYDFGNYTSASTGLSTELSSITNSGSTSSLASNTGLVNGLGNLPTLSPSSSSITTTPNQLATIQQQLGPAAGLSDVSQGVMLANTMTTTPQAQVEDTDWNSAISSNDTTSYAYNLPSDAPSNIPAPVDAVVISPNKDVSQVVSLGPVALATINTRSDGTSQLGVRSARVNPSLNFLVEPVPHVFFTGHLTSAPEQNDGLVASARHTNRAIITIVELNDAPLMTATITQPMTTGYGNNWDGPWGS